MVERAGTDRPVTGDTDTDMNEKRELAFPEGYDDYTAIENYISDLAAYYVKQMDLDTWEQAEKAIALFQDMYADGLRDKECIV